MGSFNELILDSEPIRKLQFKFGFCWQYEYRIGDKVKWNPKPRPAKADGRVVIPGIASTSLEGASDFFAIIVLNDRILSAVEIDEEAFDKLEQHLDPEFAYR